MFAFQWLPLQNSKQTKKNSSKNLYQNQFYANFPTGSTTIYTYMSTQHSKGWQDNDICIYVGRALKGLMKKHFVSTLKKERHMAKFLTQLEARYFKRDFFCVNHLQKRIAHIFYSTMEFAGCTTLYKHRTSESCFHFYRFSPSKELSLPLQTILSKAADTMVHC